MSAYKAPEQLTPEILAARREALEAARKAEALAAAEKAAQKPGFFSRWGTTLSNIGGAIKNRAVGIIELANTNVVKPLQNFGKPAVDFVAKGANIVWRNGPQQFVEGFGKIGSGIWNHGPKQVVGAAVWGLGKVAQGANWLTGGYAGKALTAIAEFGGKALPYLGAVAKQAPLIAAGAYLIEGISNIWGHVAKGNIGAALLEVPVTIGQMVLGAVGTPLGMGLAEGLREGVRAVSLGVGGPEIGKSAVRQIGEGIIGGVQSLTGTGGTVTANQGQGQQGQGQQDRGAGGTDKPANVTEQKRQYVSYGEAAAAVIDQARSESGVSRQAAKRNIDLYTKLTGRGANDMDTQEALFAAKVPGAAALLSAIPEEQRANLTIDQIKRGEFTQEQIQLMQQKANDLGIKVSDPAKYVAKAASKAFEAKDSVANTAGGPKPQTIEGLRKPKAANLGQ